MNTRIASLAAIAAISATVSTGANAGELYGAIERTLNQPTTLSAFEPADTGVAAEGVLYTEVDAALNVPAPAMTASRPYVTSLAVGGELGYPVDSPRLPAGSLERPTNLAE